MSNGLDHGVGLTGGEKRFGGAANGIPRNLLTVTFDDGRLVVVPRMTPESSVAEGIVAARSTGVESTRGSKKKRGIAERMAAVWYCKKILGKETRIQGSSSPHILLPDALVGRVD